MYIMRSRTRIQDIYAGLHDKTQPLYQQVLVLCLCWVWKNPRHRLRFVNDSFIAWVKAFFISTGFRTSGSFERETICQLSIESESLYRKLLDAAMMTWLLQYSYHTRNWQSPHFLLPLHDWLMWPRHACPRAILLPWQPNVPTKQK